MLEKIAEFLDNKKIDDELLRNLISNFIIKHTELYGNMVSFETLLSRINANLEQVIWYDPSDAPKGYGFQNMTGQYIGFNDNSINMYFSKSSLRNPQILEDFKSIFLHELTHCVYTIKNNDVYETETQVFCTMEQLLNGKVVVVNGTEIFIEPIINYISTTIDGRKNSLYVPQTLSIVQLANIFGIENIVRSAFYSNEKEFRSYFNRYSSGAYEYFQHSLRAFNSGNYDIGKSIMDNFFKNNIPDLTISQKRKNELKELRNCVAELKYGKQSEELNYGYSKSLNKDGFIQVITLSVIVSIVEIIAFLFIYFTII